MPDWMLYIWRLLLRPSYGLDLWNQKHLIPLTESDADANACLHVAYLTKQSLARASGLSSRTFTSHMAIRKHYLGRLLQGIQGHTVSALLMLLQDQNLLKTMGFPTSRSLGRQDSNAFKPRFWHFVARTLLQERAGFLCYIQLGAELSASLLCMFSEVP